MSVIFSMRRRRRITMLLVIAAASACGEKITPLDSASLALTGGSIAFIDSTARANLCPALAAGDSMRGVNDSTVVFARRNGIYDWCIPEYHDDQRFHDGNAASTDYGPVAHILAWPGLDTLTHHHFDGKYLLVGIVDLDTVLAPMPEPYTQLGLKSVHSCLYLEHHHPFLGFGKAWFTANMVTPVGDCEKTLADDAGVPLDVDIEKYSDIRTDYPAVGRFVEGQNGKTLIGIQCTDRWCIVGPKPLGAVPQFAHSTEAALKANSRGNVKGWFDDQVLGVPDATPKYNIHRAVRASLIPDANLGNHKVADYINTTKTYTHVGVAYFPKDPPDGSKYITTFGFSKGTNQVELRAELRPGTGGKVDTVWFTRVTNANGVVTDTIKTHRTDHSKWLTSVVATARFRWNDQDEDLWFACDVGCCLANGKD